MTIAFQMSGTLEFIGGPAPLMVYDEGRMGVVPAVTNYLRRVANIKCTHLQGDNFPARVIILFARIWVHDGPVSARFKSACSVKKQ